MVMTREAARELARDVLIDKMCETDEPGLMVEFEDVVERGLVGYVMEVPRPSGGSICSRPSLELHRLSGDRYPFEQAFDEGLVAIRTYRETTGPTPTPTPTKENTPS